MSSISDETQANADRLLKFDPKLGAKDLLENRKKFLEQEKQRLKRYHRSGSGGLEICRARAFEIDLLLRSFISHMSGAAGLPVGDDSLSLLAYGGYGRGELNVHSDIDIMFLHKTKDLKKLKEFIEGVTYPLYDLGLKVGTSVRTIPESIEAANGEMEIKTALIEARLLWGNEALFEKFQKTLIRKCIDGKEDKYIAERLKDQEARRAQYGNSPLMQTPNVKNGCGGLRDFQNLVWMTFFKYRTRSLGELEREGGISVGDRVMLETAYDYLMRVRNELHFIEDRQVDVLQKNLQPEVAKNLGHTERSIVARIESFMHEYYTYARHMDLITRMVEQCLALVPTRKQSPTFRQVISSRQLVKQEKIDGFRVTDGVMDGTRSLFSEQPRRLMRMFVHLQKRGWTLHPDLFRHVRESLTLIDRGFNQDPRIHESFLEILNHPGTVARVLRLMHETGVLGKFLPEFGRLTCLVQHEFFHQYTVDEHTLVCLEVLDKIWDTPFEPHSRYRPLFKEVEHPYMLYLALLMHDAGKGFPEKRHEEIGADMIDKVGRRFNLPDETRDSMVTIVRHHLLLAKVSQRFDLQDPAVIQDVADKVKSKDNLTMLTLHTFADSLGTSKTLWNEFKDSLLRQLYRNTLNCLQGQKNSAEAEHELRERRIREVRELCPKTIYEDEFDAHFSSLPGRYVESNTTKELFTDVALVHRFLHRIRYDGVEVLSPVFYWRNEPDRGYAIVKISSWNRRGFFSNAAGAFSAAGMSILNARIYSREDGIIIDTFYVVDPVTGKPPTTKKRDLFEEILSRSLVSKVNFPALIKKQMNSSVSFEPIPGERIPTRVRFNNDLAQYSTHIEVLAEDNVGLLYAVSSALSESHLDIWVARINTEKGAALDSFYISEMEGGKITSRRRLKEIEASVLNAIESIRR